MKNLNDAVVLDFFNEYDDGIIVDDVDDFINEIVDQKGIHKKYIIKIPNDNSNMEIADLVFTVGNTVIIFEEVSRFCNRNYITDELKKVIFYGRHTNTRSIVLAQRPAQINRDLLSQADSYIIFNMTDSRDLQFIEQRFDRETANQVRGLKDFDYIFRND